MFPLVSNLELLIKKHFKKMRADQLTQRNMLIKLYLLITAWTCVSGVIVVTQNPPVLTLSKGQTATLDCNLDTITDRGARWYKQIHGGVTQFVLIYYHSNTSPTYGSGYSSPKFNSTHKTKSDYSLIINNVDVDDSAVYYCKTWDNTAKEYISQ
ncbi:Immunoglobulin light [Labeo rohita]|nr:Immunoglobulin light [Labeo rohita]